MISLLVLIIGIFYEGFAEFYSVTVSCFLRSVLAFFTGFVGISLAEIVVVLSCILLIPLFVFLVICFFRNRSLFKSVGKTIIGFVLVFVSLFIHSFGICYLRPEIEKNMNLTRTKLTRQQMYLSSSFIKESLETVAENVVFSDDGSSLNPYSFNETSKIIDKGYKALVSEYPFVCDINAKSKKIMLSPLMTYTHISGVYFPFTGEANVNTNYPDYVVAYSIAHEKAHQRGIASEDEANFVAFLALLYSGDDYMRYCALMSMYDYYLDSIAALDSEMYIYFLQNTNKTILSEMYAYSEFFDKYRNSGASKIADAVNDRYIKVMGDNDGVNSYGNVVELVSAYLDKNNGLPK